MMYVIYVLHTEHKDGEVRHYVGSTEFPQFRRRMRDHTTGNGSDETRHLVQLVDAWWLTATYLTESRALEHAIHRFRDSAIACTMCNKKLQENGEPHRVRKYRTRPPSAESVALSWSSACGPTPQTEKAPQ